MIIEGLENGAGLSLKQETEDEAEWFESIKKFGAATWWDKNDELWIVPKRWVKKGD